MYEAIKLGAHIAICAPASSINPDIVRSGATYLRRFGYIPIILPHTCGFEHGSFAAPLELRLADFKEALYSPDFDAILCARGGYGCVQLLPFLPIKDIKNANKPLIGFSDVSALHAAWNLSGVKSLHAPMLKHIALGENPFEIRDISASHSCYNIPGSARAKIVGGNWAVLAALTATPYNMLGLNDTILFLEDVNEPQYKIDRMLHQLYLSGAFDNIKGLVFGQFSNCKPSSLFSSAEEMIHSRLSAWGIDIPVAFNFPIGHIDGNKPLLIGGCYELDISSGGACLSPVLS